MKEKGQKIIVLGGGESGVGAAMLAKHLGHEVFVSDKSLIKDLYKKELDLAKIPFEEGRHTLEELFSADIVIKSPGIPPTVPIISQFKEKGIPVIGEIEFAFTYATGKIIAITGSNGKTTTTKLIYHLLKEGGLNVAVGGNIGQSFARNLTSDRTYDYHVLEVSSFQLDDTIDFRPDIAVLLNITPDHLDRYEYKMEKYIQSKFRIIKNQRKEDLFLYNSLDKNIVGFSNFDKIKSEKIGLNVDFQEQGDLVYQDRKFNLNQTVLKGPHNRFNASCAIAIAKRLGIEHSIIQSALESFENEPHRMEFIGVVDEVTYINDSKATNVDAVFYALQSVEPPVIWIAGGVDKGNDYGPIMDIVDQRVKAIICLGKDNRKLIDAFGKLNKPIKETQDSHYAIQLARTLAIAGDKVMLSPACASFDLFKNYEDRGNQFKAAVQQIMDNVKMK